MTSTKLTSRSPVLAAYSALVFAFIYLPIVVLILYSFNRDGVGGFPPRHFLAVFPVRVAQCRQLPTLVERRQVGHQGAVAHRVGGLHVQVDMQARASAGQQGKRQLQHLPVELLVRFGIPKRGESLRDDILGEVTKVMDRDREARSFGGRIDPLGSIG